MNVNFLLVSVVSSLLCQSSSGDTTSLDPGGRNVCKLSRRRPYLNDALSYRDWQTGRTEVIEHRCCEGWAQRGSSCPEAKCETPCEYGYCATPDYCACQDGWTGPACSKICPAISEGGRCLVECDCPSGMCDFTTRTCACPLGFIGLNCSIPCPVGYHGADCLLQCQCDHINNTCQPDTGSCSELENIAVVPSVPQLQLQFFRMTLLTGCGVVAIVVIISTTAHAVRKRRTRRVFNVRKRTMSMTPITRRASREENQCSRSTCNNSGRLHLHHGFPSPVSSGSTSYVGMRDLSNEAGTNSRPVSTASTTVSIVESLSEFRDTIYEVRGDVLGSWGHQGSGPHYTNSSVFSAETARRLNQRLRAVPSEISVTDSDTDDYNYPYADLGNLRLPVRADSNRLSTCSDDTEYVVVLNQEQGEVTYASHLKGMLRGSPSGMSNTDVPSTSTSHITVPSLQNARGDKGLDHYQVPRSPAVRRNTTDTPCDQQFVRSYVTSIKSLTDTPTGLRRNTGHRRTRRVKEIVQCPPPPPPLPCGNSETPNTAHVYVNGHGTGSGGFSVGPPKPKRQAPPVPKPRTRPTAEPAATTQDTEEVNSETQTVERFI